MYFCLIIKFYWENVLDAFCSHLAKCFCGKEIVTQCSRVAVLAALPQIVPRFIICDACALDCTLCFDYIEQDLFVTTASED